ncbi:MAG: hypothetical protein NC453_29845 [Muribaculum sp.]|nr:hypothetical protein [Muribaculum sp.]
MAERNGGSGGMAQNTTSQSVEIFDGQNGPPFAIRSHWRATYTTAHTLNRCI